MEPNSDLGTEEEMFGLGLKGRVGICQLIKAGEGFPGRGYYKEARDSFAI